jgi:hypothetical protein
MIFYMRQQILNYLLAHEGYGAAISIFNKK